MFVCRIALLMLMLTSLAACVAPPSRQELATATVNNLRRDRELVTEQRGAVHADACPSGTERRVYEVRESNLRGGYSGGVRAFQRVECVPPGTPRTVPPQVSGDRSEGAYFVNPYPQLRWHGGNHPRAGYAPYGNQPYWDGNEWVCRNWYDVPYRCVFQGPRPGW